jgi:4-hydroxybenzoate polyprenyltransferase
VLGICFGWGALMGWAASEASLSGAANLLFLGSILWVIGYDTIYALQDIEDDIIVGIGSTARAYEGHVGRFIALCYVAAVILVLAALVAAGAHPASYLGALLFGGHLAWQVSRLKTDDPQRALMLFRSNRDAGLLLFAGLVLGGLLAFYGV